MSAVPQLACRSKRYQSAFEDEVCLTCVFVYIPRNSQVVLFYFWGRRFDHLDHSRRNFFFAHSNLSVRDSPREVFERHKIWRETNLSCLMCEQLLSFLCPASAFSPPISQLWRCLRWCTSSGRGLCCTAACSRGSSRMCSACPASRTASESTCFIRGSLA